MATAKKAAAAKKTAAPAKKPAAPVVLVKSDAPGALTYRVTGRIRFDGETLRPADEATGREADTVELTERQAYGLRGFVELIEDATAEAPTE
ncbi:hypothetical protein [Hydrogenophaga taeniospiralis]|uniref:hypothetical protein n=1 Tax=Hydrogenophaga taeniospiralis TaxID=65656 RepID=UPI001CFBCEE8|nr:hypothetical protein [Hydrogenophaga taeniospiralis]UCU94011.1 hypothetical protein KI616_25295 [Hydrogenophaga taeniospiralis]